MAVADKFPVLLVPEPVGGGFETGEQRDGFHLLEERVGLMAFLQIVIRNARAQMMDVMETDVAGKPLQDARQFVEGTAFQSGGNVAPVFPAFPINIFKLMLDIKHPHARATSYHDDDQLDQQI